MRERAHVARNNNNHGYTKFEEGSNRRKIKMKERRAPHAFRCYLRIDGFDLSIAKSTAIFIMTDDFAEQPATVGQTTNGFFLFCYLLQLHCTCV